MNFYEHHLNDFAEATAHLSFVEDAAYSRLIRKYYATERPLPADPKILERLIGARTKDEKQAVQAVLEEFFRLEDDGWHNKRCDEEIDRYHEKQRKARVSAQARWDKPDSERNASGMRTHPPRNANASKTHNGRNALQSPVPSPQSPDKTSLSPPGLSVGTPNPRARTDANGDQAHAVRRQIEAAYPKGLHRGDHWMLAERAIRTLLEQGEDPQALRDAAAKYCEQQTAVGKLGTDSVLRPSTFYGTEAWRGPFPAPATKAETRLSSNISAAEEFMRRTESQ